MSHFDELTTLFDVWRNDWIAKYRAHQFLPSRIARRFQEFIECPVSFEENSIGVGPTKYVSPTRAKWDAESEKFILSAYQSNFEDVDFHDDGYFYFGLRVYLEHGPATYPKQPFWFLFRCNQEDGKFLVFVKRSEKLFKFDSDANGEIDAFCTHLFELLKVDLAANPLVQAKREAFSIGFTKLN